MNKTFLLSLTLLGLMAHDPLMAIAPQAKPRSKAVRAWVKHRKWAIPVATVLGLLAVGGGAYALHRRQKNGHTSAAAGSGMSSATSILAPQNLPLPGAQPPLIATSRGCPESGLATTSALTSALPVVQDLQTGLSAIDVPESGQLYDAHQYLDGDGFMNYIIAQKRELIDPFKFWSEESKKVAIEVMQKANFVPIKVLSFPIVQCTIFIDARQQCMVWEHGSATAWRGSFVYVPLHTIWGCRIPSDLLNPPGAVSTAGPE